MSLGKKEIIEWETKKYIEKKMIPKVAPSLFHKSASSGLTRNAALKVGDKSYGK